LLGSYDIIKSEDSLRDLNHYDIIEQSYIDKVTSKDIEVKLRGNTTPELVNKILNDSDLPAAKSPRKTLKKHKEGNPIFSVTNADILGDFDKELLVPVGADIDTVQVSDNLHTITFSFKDANGQKVYLECAYTIHPLEVNSTQDKATFKIDIVRKGFIVKAQILEMSKYEQLNFFVTVKNNDEIALGNQACLIQWGGEDVAKSKASGTKLPLESNNVNQIQVQEGQILGTGQLVNKIVKEVSKTRDITGGLTRVAELFEARYKEKEVAICSDVEGEVVREETERGKVKLVIRTNASVKGQFVEVTKVIPKGRQVLVHVASHVQKGDQLCNGAVNPHDILAKGTLELANYIVREIQAVYELQGVRINDKHLEVIVRQMLRKGRITDPGDTLFLPEEQVDKALIEKENEKLKNKPNARPAKFAQVLLGITKASLSTESFISASSFQETTKVLTSAAMSGKIDYLRGLKENVIMGRLIPAGTGFRAYQNDLQQPSELQKLRLQVLPIQQKQDTDA